MNLRQRVLAVLYGDKPDYVPWLGDLDYWIAALNEQNALASKYQGRGIFQLHRDLGVGYYLQGYFPFITNYENIQIEQEMHGSHRVTTVKTPVGNIFQTETYLAQSFCWATEEHYIKTWRDLKAFRFWYNHSFYSPDYQQAEERIELVGDNGIVLCYLPKCPLMEMVALQAGISAVTFALMDAPDEFNETMSVLEKKADEAAEIVLKSPAECLMIPENLSSEVIGKKLYLRYMRPFEEKWIKKIKALGKHSFIHMDGTLRGLIREVSETGFDVLEALTPAPVGDIPIEELHNWTGKDTVIWGGLPGIYFSKLVSDEEFDRFVIMVLGVMRKIPRFVLGVADQVPPGADWDRINRVSQLVEQYGSIVW